MSCPTKRDSGIVTSIVGPSIERSRLVWIHTFRSSATCVNLNTIVRPKFHGNTWVAQVSCKVDDLQNVFQELVVWDLDSYRCRQCWGLLRPCRRPASKLRLLPSRCLTSATCRTSWEGVSWTTSETHEGIWNLLKESELNHNMINRKDGKTFPIRVDIAWYMGWWW